MDRSPPHPAPQGDAPLGCAPLGEAPRRRRWRGRLGATVLSAAAHAGLLLALLLSWRAPPMAIDQPPVLVSLIAPLAPPPKPPAPAPAKRTPAAKHVKHEAPAAAPRLAVRRSPAPPVAEPLPAAPAPTTGEGLSGAEIAGAASAGEDGDGGGQGGGGGECNMARRVQAAVRKDPLARAAIHAASGHAIMIWNGDWVQSGLEDGKGLAAVREAITWEVAFAPAACRQQHVRGLVLLSLNDGSARLALGAGEWRWSDLLGLR